MGIDDMSLVHATFIQRFAEIGTDTRATMPWVALDLRPVYAGRRNNSASYSCSAVEALAGSTILTLPATLGRVNLLTCWWQWCPNNKKNSCCDCPEYCRGWRKKTKESVAYSEWLSREMLQVDIDGDMKRVGRRWTGTNSSLTSRDKSGALWDWIISVPPGSSHSIQTKQLRFRIQLLETLPVQTSLGSPKTPKRTTSSCQDDWRRAKTRRRTAMKRDHFWIHEPALEPKETSTAIKAGQPLSFLSAPDESSQESPTTPRPRPMPVDWTLAAPQCPVPAKEPSTPKQSFGQSIAALSSVRRAAVAEPLDSAPDIGFCTQDSLTRSALIPRDHATTTHEPPTKVPPVTPGTLKRRRSHPDSTSHDVVPRRLFTQNDSCNADNNGPESSGSVLATTTVEEKSLSLPSNTSSTGTSCRLGTQPESLEAMLPVRAAGETAASAVLSLPWESGEASSDEESKLGAAVATVDTGPSRQNTPNPEVGSALLVNVRGTTTPLERVAKCCDLSRADWVEIRRQTSAGTLPHVVAELVAAMNRDEASPGSGQFCIPSLVRDCQVSGFDSRKKNT
jgi:hypothetical protein